MKLLITIFSINYFLLMQWPIQEKWVVPEEARLMENPSDTEDKENLSIGKSLYLQNCRTCHGKSGLGDGSQTKQLDMDLIDFNSTGFQSQTDGAIYYKVSTGRGVMPEFGKKLDEEDRWLIVNYLRTFK